MAACRRVAAVLVFAFVAVHSLSSRQEPDRWRVQTPMRAQPSPASPEAAVLRPGTLLTAVADSPQTAGFVEVATDGGQRGWVPSTSGHPLAILEAEQQLETFGGLAGVGAARGNVPFAARGGQRKTFDKCPLIGCATEPRHKLTNTRKHTFLPAKGPIKVPTFEELDLLQALTDSKGIPQGEHVTAAQRKQLTNFMIGTQTISEGDHIAVTGFIATARSTAGG